MLGGGLNYLGSCSKGRSMLRQLHIAQSLFGESDDLGVFREEMGDGFNKDLHLFPALHTFLILKKPSSNKIALVGLYTDDSTNMGSPTCMYIRVCHIFLDFKLSRYIEVYSFWGI